MFAKFKGRHLQWSSVFSTVAGWDCHFTKNMILLQVFSNEFCEIISEQLFLKTPVKKNTAMDKLLR